MISVLLPTVRPERFMQSLLSVAPAAGRVPYEVVVVADFADSWLGCNDPLHHLRCRWVKQVRVGPIEAINEGLRRSRGTYVFVMNDESVLEVDALELLYDEAVKRPRRVYAPMHLPAYTFTYFGLPFVPFPFMHRDLVTMLGGLFDPAYRAFYADPDLGMRAHQLQVPLVTVEAAVIHHHNGDDEAKRRNWDQFFSLDQATFRARWGHLGEFHDC